MSIRVSCHCGKVLLAREEDAGRPAVCPVCATQIKVPSRSMPPVQALPEVFDDPLPEARTARCRLCHNTFASNDIYDADGVITCRFCYQKEASAPVRSSRLPKKKAPNPRHLDNHLATSAACLLLSFLFCVPIGAIPLYYSMSIDNLLLDDDYETAQRYEENARWWNNVCFGLMAVGAGVYAVLALLYVVLAA